MMTPDVVAELVADLVEARLLGNQTYLVHRIDRLLKGPVGDCLNVVLVLAGLIAENAGEPDEGFHRITVTHEWADGTETTGSTLDLPPHVAIFVQMITAIANGDRVMARDLFVGYVNGDGHRALRLLAYALTEVAHNTVECDCAPETEGESA